MIYFIISFSLNSQTPQFLHRPQFGKPSRNLKFTAPF